MIFKNLNNISLATFRQKLGKLKCFMGIEIFQSNSDVIMSQRKFILDILEEIDMLDCKPVDTIMDSNVKLVFG